MKNILVVGSGGREHALAWKLSQSKQVGKLFVAPGNAGTAQIAQNVDIAADNIEELATFAKENDIALTVVGPDNSLALGIVDYFQSQELLIFGPTKNAAEIEWSKTFAKELMKKYDIPTAKYASFTSQEEALKYVQNHSLPLVVKEDGLAMGKGVVICKTLAESEAAMATCKKSGGAVIIEEYLEGTEISAHALCCGSDFLLFPLAQDHKRIGEGNTGPNTGGMGTVCPVPGPLEEIRTIIAKTLNALKLEGREFSGILFPGIMLTKDGPKVLEFNARFGDPETQVFTRLLRGDLLEILEGAAMNRFDDIELRWESGAASCVILASGGYPAEYTAGYEIAGINKISNNDVVIFHAGTKESKGKLVTSGGRVLGVTAAGRDLEQALKLSYEMIKNISFQGMQYRKDIGAQHINKKPEASIN